MFDKLGPSATQEEIDLVFDTIVAQSQKENNHTVTISNIDLADKLIGDIEWKVPRGDSELDKQYLLRRNERVKNRLSRGLAKKGVKSIVKITDGYQFVLDSFIETNKPEEKKVFEQTDGKVESYKTKFYPPYWFRDLIEDLTVGKHNVYVSGPTGCGKDRTIVEALHAIGRKYIRFAAKQYLDISQLIGSKEICTENGVSVTKYVPGILLDAFQNGLAVVIDEFDTMPPDMACGLHTFLERESDVTITTEKGEEVIKRHPDFCIIATGNTLGHGEGGAIYAGTEQGNRATLNRFTAQYDTWYDNKLEARIVSQWLPESVVKALYNLKDTASEPAGVIVKIREAIKNGDITDPLSFRSIESFAQSMHYRGWHKGWFNFILYTINPVFHDQIFQIIRMQLGEEFLPSINDYDSEQPLYIPDMVKKMKKKGDKYKDFCVTQRSTIVA